MHREKNSCFKRKRTANFESRKIKTYLEWSIQDHIFSNVTNHFQRSFTIDLFPSRVNKKATRNYAFYKKPDSVGNDVFSFSWKFEFFYAFPHFHTSHTSHNEQAEGIIIISLSTTQPWFTTTSSAHYQQCQVSLIDREFHAFSFFYCRFSYTEVWELINLSGQIFFSYNVCYE